MKKILKIFLYIILFVVLLAVLFFGWLTVTEYRPADRESVEIVNSGDVSGKQISVEDDLNVLSWNIGYAGLGKDSDFFMDGGTSVQAADRETVQSYLNGIAETASSQEDTDIYMFQEVDIDSKRSYRMDERESLSLTFGAHALNHSCSFVPSGMPPIGRVHAGLYTTSDYEISSAERISLPCPFSWPVRTANLKRCLLVTRFPIEGTDSELCLINLHLEAYDDGEGKIAQTQALRDIMQEEYEKGNYVIAGGDFNQVFPGSLELYPNSHPDLWEPGVLDYDILPDGWNFAYDSSVPTCRLLNQAYDPSDTENTQYYVIDGFITSPNLQIVQVQTLDEAFADSDHNPVKLTVSFSDSSLR